MHLESDEKRSVMICLYVARHLSNTDMSSPSFQLLSQRGESKVSERKWKSCEPLSSPSWLHAYSRDRGLLISSFDLSHLKIE